MIETSDLAHDVLPRDGMTMKNTPQLLFVALTGLVFAAASLTVNAQPPKGQVTPDNSKVNERDRAPGAVTADKQKMNAMDRELTAKIRRSIMADKSMSVYAHNVKIVSQNGTVTLKGPVRSDSEVKSIIDKATTVTGDAAKVTNQMSVKP